ncbi:unnamed protein product [Callosobruchus maculatus]|uniref:WD repeat-containing protein 55 homolog n=1 Tax=Callosobruchus maculatus TaxID=64391 RepID=A0A653DJ14_CALMS|nr:unnamed protein product [Callosobruchus maculatus]
MVLEMTRKVFNEPTFMKDVSEYGQILLVQFAPFEWCQDLLLIVFQDKILLAQLQLTEILQVEILTEFSHSNRCTAIAISPQTSLLSVPQRLLFVAAGSVCKERWTRIRDNHRKALNLRKTKSGQAASKLKPPKFVQELSFLTQYLNDGEERRSSLSSSNSVIVNDDTHLETPHDSSSPRDEACDNSKSCFESYGIWFKCENTFNPAPTGSRPMNEALSPHDNTETLLVLSSNENVLVGHSSYINDVNFDPDNKYLASTGDDHAVKIWYADGTYKTSFDLTSPGISVCWQREDTCELLVAEKIGIIRFFNVESESPVLSLDYTKPLCSAHWAPSDRDLVASLHSGELLIWELTKPCLPQQHNIFFNENGGNIKFSPQGELVAAVNSLDSSMKIIHVKSQTVKLTASVALPTNITWHYRYPLVCLGDDYRLCFWKTA